MPYTGRIANSTVANHFCIPWAEPLFGNVIHINDTLDLILIAKDVNINKFICESLITNDWQLQVTLFKEWIRKTIDMFIQWWTSLNACNLIIVENWTVVKFLVNECIQIEWLFEEIEMNLLRETKTCFD